MKYICTQDLYIDRYDADGFRIENKCKRVPKGSIWEIDTECIKFIGGKDSIHLDRVWKSKKAKTHEWIEITKETFKTHFQRIYEQGDRVQVNGIKYTVIKVDRRCNTPYLIGTWISQETID